MKHVKIFLAIFLMGFFFVLPQSFAQQLGGESKTGQIQSAPVKSVGESSSKMISKKLQKKIKTNEDPKKLTPPKNLRLVIRTNAEVF